MWGTSHYCKQRNPAAKWDRIDQPTLLFWGQNDPFGFQEVDEHMVEIMPNAELHVVGMCYAPCLTEAERIGPIATRFLSFVDIF